MKDPDLLPGEKLVREASFNPKVRNYWLLSGAMVLTVCIITIPLVPIWWVLGQKLTSRWLKRMRCILTDRSLKFRKGVLVRIEKTIPLDKITDLGMVQGPIMRYYDLEAVSVETAGQSGQGALLTVIGIVNTRDFRDAVLSQRDQFLSMRRETEPAEPATSEISKNQFHRLEDISDTLKRIEDLLRDRAKP